MPKPPQQRRPVPATHASVYRHGELEDWLAARRPLRHFTAWLWLRSRAAFTDNTWEFWGGKRYMLKKGELLTSKADFANHLDLSLGDAQRLLGDLVEMGLIEREPGNAVRPTRIRICDYESSRPQSVFGEMRSPQAKATVSAGQSRSRWHEEVSPSRAAARPVEEAPPSWRRRRQTKPFPDSHPVRWPHSEWVPSSRSPATAA